MVEFKFNRSGYLPEVLDDKIGRDLQASLTRGRMRGTTSANNQHKEQIIKDSYMVNYILKRQTQIPDNKDRIALLNSYDDDHQIHGPDYFTLLSMILDNKIEYIKPEPNEYFAPPYLAP